MLDFKIYLKRYGEIGVQALIENIERSEGIRPSGFASLESRWNKIMQDVRSGQPGLAA
jgi:hypothetical protein